MKPRYIVEWTNEDGKSWGKTFTNKVKMIRFVMYLTFNKRAYSVLWKETGLHKDSGINELYKGLTPVPENIKIDDLKGGEYRI